MRLQVASPLLSRGTDKDQLQYADANKGEREDSLFSQKQELLKKRKQLLDIKLQLQKDIHTTQPINFGNKYGTLSEKKELSIADGLRHRFSDVRFLDRLECHLLCGLKVVNYNKSKVVVQFRPSYQEKILPEIYAISLVAGNNGYSVEKYYLPHSVKIKPVVRRWSPLKQDNLKNFFLDIKQQINAFHHRQNQLLQLEEWANNQNISLKVFHPLSLQYVVIAVRMDDNLKFRNYRSLDMIFQYDSVCYLPTKVDIESSEMEEEELAVAKEQFSAFKLYSLREAFEICCIKTERFSLSTKEDVPNENLNEEAYDNSLLSEEEEDNITDVSNIAVSEQLKNFRTRSQVNKVNRVLPVVEKARKSKSEPLTEGKRNKKNDNSSSGEEDDIAEVSTIDDPENANFHLQLETKRNSGSVLQKAKMSNPDSSSSVEEDDIAEVSTIDAPEYANFHLQLETKRNSGSILQKARKSDSKRTVKGVRNIASKSGSNTLQAKKQLKTSKTNRKAPKKKYPSDDAPDNILHTRKKKSALTSSPNKGTKEVPTPLQKNKITRYLNKK